MKENQQVFNGTQENMCEAARLGCNLFDGEQKVFEENNLVYSKDWSDMLRQKIKDALALPGEGARRSLPSKKRAQLMTLGYNCIDAWVILSSCIEKIAAKDELDSLLAEAGHDNYEEAVRNNWPKIKALMAAGSDFIANNTDWLRNGGKGMSPAFPAKFNAAATAFAAASDGFYDAKGDMPLETLTKVEAMNEVYTTLIGMLNDGKKYFRRNKAMRNMFSYRSLLVKVQGTSNISGVNITAQAEGTLLPLTTASAVFMPTGKSFNATGKGIIYCDVPADKYTVTITAPGYQPIQKEIIVKAGTTGRKKLIFTKAMEAGKQETA